MSGRCRVTALETRDQTKHAPSSPSFVQQLHMSQVVYICSVDHLDAIPGTPAPVSSPGRWNVWGHLLGGQKGEHEAHAPRLDAGSTCGVHQPTRRSTADAHQDGRHNKLVPCTPVAGIDDTHILAAAIFCLRRAQTYVQPGTHPQHLEDQQPLSSRLHVAGCIRRGISPRADLLLITALLSRLT